jgi:hypothetical protein
MNSDRLDFAGSVAKDAVSKIIVKKLVEAALRLN